MDSELPRGRWVALIVAAVAVILAPQMFRFVPLPPVALTENRELASPPKLPTDLTSLHTFPQKLNDYLQDSFPLRAQAIQGINFARFLAGYSAVAKVVVGKDSWLFYDNGSHMSQGIGTIRLHPSELSDWMLGLQQRLSYAKSQGFSFYVLPAPQQESIYPEKLPTWLERQVQPTTEMDQIVDAAMERGFDQVVDVRRSLIASKPTKKPYGPYDIHWNGNGAYIAYYALMKRISRDFPDLAPLPESSFPHSPPATQDGLARMLGIANFVKDNEIYYATAPLHDPNRTTYLSDRRDWGAPQILDLDSASERTLLLIRDSFSSELVPLLKPHFRRMIVVHADDGAFRKDLIERYHPDIVIFESIANALRFRMKPLP